MKRLLSLLFTLMFVALAVPADARGHREYRRHREYREHHGYHGYGDYGSRIDYTESGVQGTINTIVPPLREIQSDLDDRSYRSRIRRVPVQMAQEEEQLPIGVFFEGEWLCNNTANPIVLLVDKRAVSILRPGRKTSVAAYAGHEIEFRKGER